MRGTRELYCAKFWTVRTSATAPARLPEAKRSLRRAFR
jgi:hypothetical protein